MGLPRIIAELKATLVSEEASRKRNRYVREDRNAQAARRRGDDNPEQWLQDTLATEAELG